MWLSSREAQIGIAVRLMIGYALILHATGKTQVALSSSQIKRVILSEVFASTIYINRIYQGTGNGFFVQSSLHTCVNVIHHRGITRLTP